jgi:hypothetical protein
MMFRSVFFLFLVLLILFSSCENEMPEEVIPFALVSEDINVKYIQNINLTNIGGFIYHDAGYRGIIIYHEGNGVYRAFERACTFDPKSSCDPIVVDESGLFMKHECCNSTFDFFGNPTGGPASIRLLRYSVYVDGDYLKIRNEN